MEYAFDFTTMPEYMTITSGGNAEIEGFSQLLSDLLHSPEWKKGTKRLIDIRTLNMSSLTTQDIDSAGDILSILSKELGDGKRALVAEGAAGIMAANYYCSMMGQAYAISKIFDNITEARNWLLTP